MGHSAGGYNAAMLALDARWLTATGHRPNELAGWMGLAGPYDFYPITNPDAKPVFFHPNYPPDSQPIAFAQANGPRSFLVAAADDELVNPQRNTVQFAGLHRRHTACAVRRLEPLVDILSGLNPGDSYC